MPTNPTSPKGVLLRRHTSGLGPNVHPEHPRVPSWKSETPNANSSTKITPKHNISIYIYMWISAII